MGLFFVVDWQSFIERCNNGMVEAAIHLSAVSLVTTLSEVVPNASSVSTFLSGQKTLAASERPCLKDPHQKGSNPEIVV